MSPESFESDRVSRSKHTLFRYWWVGVAIVCLIAGCGPASKPVQISSVGLRPIPPWHVHEFQRIVESLQPALQWEAFPRPGDFKLDKTGRLPSITNVTYELRIWTRDQYGLSEPVYSRHRLTAPNHRVEVPLAPQTGYIWMVRAWFDLNGRPRVTEWSVRYPPSSEYYDNRRGWNRSPSNCYTFWLR